MTRPEGAIHDHLLDAIWKLEQPKGVSHRRTTPPDPHGYLMLGQSEIIDKAIEGGSLFYWIEIVAMDVLNDGLFETFPITGITNNSRNGYQSCISGGPPPALTGHEFIALLRPTDKDRLQHADLSNRLSELGHLLVVKYPTRLVTIRLDIRNAHHLETSITSDAIRTRLPRDTDRLIPWIRLQITVRGTIGNPVAVRNHTTLGNECGETST
tara:strand:- start:1001 stop:1633 length:633 start_codon:yes stop_codon:yes gene_type:complete